MPGHYEWVTKRVKTRGHFETVFVPAKYRWVRQRCGRRARVLVRRAYRKKVWRPGHWTTVREKVWIPATTVYSCGY